MLRLSWRIEAQQEAAQADGARWLSLFRLVLKLLTLLGLQASAAATRTNPGRTGSWHTTAEAPTSSSPQHHSQLR